jgi:hypothetical protein
MSQTSIVVGVWAVAVSRVLTAMGFVTSVAHFMLIMACHQNITNKNINQVTIKRSML